MHSKTITNRTSQSAGVRIRASIFNRCNGATVRTREVPLVYAYVTLLLYHVHVVASRNKWFTGCETSGKLTLWTPLLIYVDGLLGCSINEILLMQSLVKEIILFL